MSWSFRRLAARLGLSPPHAACRRAGRLDQDWIAALDALIGRPPEHDLRRIMEAILYIDRTGIPWRYPPHDFAPG